MATQSRPGVPMSVMRQHSPAIADAIKGLDQALAASGPLDEKIQKLIICATCVGTRQRDVFLTYAARARKAGASEAELRQAVLLALAGGAA